jgi:hypothetical protein
MATFMSNHRVGLAVLMAFVWAGASRMAAADEPALARFQFAGMAAWQRGPNGANLAKIEQLPASAELRQKTLTKLGLFAPQLLNIGAQTNLGAAIEPLAADFWQYGGVVEVRGLGAQRQALIAVTMPEARRAVWKTSLDQLKAAAGGRLALLQEGRWTIVGTGDKAAESVAQFQQTLKTSGAPELKPETWLQLYLNLPKLAPLLGLGAREDFPALDLAFGSKADDVRATGVLTFAKPISWRPDPWRIPRNIIKDPLVSFTAANGIAPWLEKFQLFQEMRLSNPLNQVYGWSQSGLPLLIYGAAAVKDSTNSVTELAGKLPPAVYNFMGQTKVGEFFWASNRAEIFWQGLPIMAPRLKAVSEPAGQYVTGELFPASPRATNAPPELFAQVSGKNNLVYYSWEITEVRISSWRQFFQLAPLFAPARQVPTDFPAQKWLQAVGPKLGNTITEVTYVSPRQMNFTRRGNLGLSGFELVLLARSLDLWGMPPDFGILRRPPVKAPAKP